MLGRLDKTFKVNSNVDDTEVVAANNVRTIVCKLACGRTNHNFVITEVT